jgi:signal transduction histidine kinase
MLEAILNLLDNAVKFTPSGGVVRLGLRATAKGPLLAVSDNGPGIPAAERDRVFRRFYRGDKSRRSKGIGLGLSLVAAVARLHDFQLSLGEGRPGLVVELRCWAVAAAAPRAAVTFARSR